MSSLVKIKLKALKVGTLSGQIEDGYNRAWSFSTALLTQIKQGPKTFSYVTHSLTVKMRRAGNF